MDKSGKIWGCTSSLFHRNNVEIHRLEGVPGGFSSEHKHQSKYNKFFVESGIIEVISWKGAEGPDKVLLHAGESCVVKPGIFHKFKVIEPCVVYEIYWVDLDKEDIVRRTRGGWVPVKHSESQ